MLSQTKKVTAFVGSVRKKNTYKAVVQFLEQLKAQGDVEVELVRLSEYKLGVCKGCCLCFNRGEEFCPLKDDRDILMARIAESDGVVFASPNYSWHMSGLMKIFLGRFGLPFTGHATSGRSSPVSLPKALDRAITSWSTSISSANPSDSTR